MMEREKIVTNIRKADSWVAKQEMITAVLASVQILNLYERKFMVSLQIFADVGKLYSTKAAADPRPSSTID
jgi:hypothetical protein